MLEQLWEDPLGDHPVFQHVRHPGRNAEVVFQHINRAILVAHQIAAANVRLDPMSRINAYALRPEVN